MTKCWVRAPSIPSIFRAILNEILKLSDQLTISSMNAEGSSGPNYDERIIKMYVILRGLKDISCLKNQAWT